MMMVTTAMMIVNVIMKIFVMMVIMIIIITIVVIIIYLHLHMRAFYSINFLLLGRLLYSKTRQKKQ